MGRRVLNRKDLRADFEAAERRKQDGEQQDEAEAEDEDEDEDEEDEEEKEETEGEAEAEGEEEEEPKVVAPKKKTAPAPGKTKPRSRSAKVVRLKVVWAVFNNSNQRVASFDYPRRKDADDLAAKLTVEKKTTHFVQPVKEPIEKKKECHAQNGMNRNLRTVYATVGQRLRRKVREYRSRLHEPASLVGSITGSPYW